MGLNALFLGYGRMGAALGEAWLDAGLVTNIDAIDPLRAMDVKANIYRRAADLPTTRYDLVIMAVKPAMAREALNTLPSDQLHQATIISVMAGVSLQTLRAALPVARPVVRSMPNTPVMVRQGCVGLYADDDVTPALRNMLGNLFNAVGQAFWVQTEAQLHAVTAISGSGPAYYHLFSEALADAAEKLGLPRQLARKLAAQTALGAATLQTQGDMDFCALRQAVTSPNGTTHAAIEAFEQGQALRRLVDDAAARAYQRSVELSYN
ncbi:MAG: pyrroline-5-carboxylate reductase [Lautropia sp.]|nr:pyrroline-5-carboxylate reductase [Lautropia sp.]